MEKRGSNFTTAFFLSQVSTQAAATMHYREELKVTYIWFQPQQQQHKTFYYIQFYCFTSVSIQKSTKQAAAAAAAATDYLF